MYPRQVNIPKNYSFFLFGARGTGKSTLVKQYFPENSYYIDLLLAGNEERYALDPDAFYRDVSAQKDISHVIVDEVQKLPKLLDLVHKLIEETNIHFVLTGSSARKLRHGSANLLAGRAFERFLHPLTFEELGGDFDLNDVLSWGSLPMVVQLKDPSDRKDFLQSYTNTYLKQEVWAEQIIRKLEPFRKFLVIAAQQNSKILTTALVQDSITAGVSQFILISSIHVFGDALVGDVTELTLPAPSSDYGRSRLRLEEDVHDLSSTSTMNSLVLRMTNTFGAPVFPQNATWNLLIHDLCRQAVTSDRLVLNTNGLGYRNVLPLHDATNAIAQISTGALPSGTYLLAGPKTYQIREIASLVKTRAEFILQKPIAIDFEHSDVTADRYFTVRSTSLEIHGVTIGDSLINELDELIRTAYTQFCRVST